MDAVSLLRNRVAAVGIGLRGLVDGLQGLDLSRPALPGTSPPGLTLWHIPRTQDWLVNTCVRVRPEVADAMTGVGLPDPERYGFGTGLTPDEAAEAAAQVQPEALLSYAEAVGADADAWLAGLDESALDETVPLLERQRARAAYTTEAALDEVRHLDGLTVGVLMLRPALWHVATHMGEIELLTQAMRRAGD